MELLAAIILAAEPKPMPATGYFLLFLCGCFAVAALWLNIYEKGGDDELR